MKINRLDAHDRYEYFTKQSFDIAECCQDLINQRTFGDHPFYIFAHARTEDDGVNKRLIWQPRLTKPLPQSNSMLFKAYPGSDNIKIIWMIPDRTMWHMYQKGKMTQSELISESIWDFENDRKKLELPEPDDLSESEIHAIYKEIAVKVRNKSDLVT